MTKQIFMLMAIVGVLGLASCTNSKGTATAEITVKKSGKVVSGETVYQFSSSVWNHGTTFRQPIHADRSVVTDETGVAVFHLEEVKDLATVSDQTTLYYATFNPQKVLTGQVGITIRKGETKQATINQ